MLLAELDAALAAPAPIDIEELEAAFAEQSPRSLADIKKDTSNLRESAKDAARLDWLIENEHQVFEVNGHYWLREVTEAWPLDGSSGYAYADGKSTARAAIDAAMSESSNTSKKD